MRVLLVVLFAIWCLPVKLGAALRWHAGERAMAAYGVTLCGVRFVRKVGWKQNVHLPSGEGTLQSEDQEKRPAGVGWLVRLVRTVFISDKARKWFSRTSVTECAKLYIQVGFADAAGCALMDAALNAILGMAHRAVPNGCFRSRAALGQKSGIQGMCIVSIRLGNLLTAAILGACGYMLSGKKHKEEKRWSIVPLKI